MTTVREAMATNLVTFTPQTDIHRAIRVLLDRHLSGAPVVDDAGRLVGMLSKKDCLRVAFEASYHRTPAGRVADFMHADVRVIPPDMDVVQAAELFLDEVYGRFPVVEGDRLVGQISRHDVLRALADLS